MTPQDPTTIVSVTPLPIRADSRTLKQASSVGRLGYRSVALEGGASGPDIHTPFFDLLSIDPDGEDMRSTEPGHRAIQTETAPSDRDEENPGSDADAGDGLMAPDGDASDTLADASMKPVCDEHDQTDNLSKEPEAGTSFRKSLRAVLERLPGGKHMVQVLWRLEFEVKQNRARLEFEVKQNRARLSKLWRRSYINIPELLFLALYRGTGKIWHSLPRPPRLVCDLHSFVRYLFRYLSVFFVNPLIKMPRAPLYYLHHFYQFPAVYIRCLVYRSKFIYDAHDFYSDMESSTDISDFWRNWVLPWERWLEAWCVHKATAVVTVNQGIAALMRERFGCEPVILRNAHDKRLDHPVEQTIRDVIGLNERDFLIVSIGNWKPGMAIDAAFDALASLPKRYHLALLGAHYPDYEDVLEAAKLQDRVHLLPPVLPEQVVPFIRSADASIILYFSNSPNYQNALPNRFFQAVAAGLPLIYPPLTEIQRLAEQYRLGIMVDPQDSEAVALAIREIGDRSKQAKAIRENVLDAQDALSWEREEIVLKDLLESLVGQPNAATAAEPQLHMRT